MLLQGFKELVERCHSEKTLNFEHKKNAEKMQMIRQNKLSGILACSIRGQEIVATIEERIGQLNVDDLEARKLNSKSVLAEETSFIMFATGKHSTTRSTLNMLVIFYWNFYLIKNSSKNDQYI